MPHTKIEASYIDIQRMPFANSRESWVDNVYFMRSHTLMLNADRLYLKRRSAVLA